MLRALQSTTSTKPIHSWIPSALSITAISVALTTGLQFFNPRTLVSWHGFLHSAIANRFPGAFQTPENPFFAGERLPYYWFHHYVAHLIGRAFHLDPIHSFQIITVTGLIILWVSAAALGARYLGSVKTGLLAGFLALTGVNPLGPAIAVGKHLILGQQLLNAPRTAEVETTFVSEHLSGELLTQPLLGALYVSADWRRGQNIPWYLDNSSRGVALALLFPLAFTFIGAKASWARVLAIGAVAALLTAFSPLIGLAAVGSIFAATVLIAAIKYIKPEILSARPMAPTALLAIAAVVGMLSTSPTYYHLFLVGGSGLRVQGFGVAISKAIALAFNVFVLLPLAVWGCLRARETLRLQCWILLIAACALLFVVPPVWLTDDTEHNLANTAYCLLAFPAVAWIRSGGGSRTTYACVIGLFIPTTLGTIASYLARPALPIAFENGVLHRTPAGDPLEELYQWTRASTPAEAVFVADPARPVKMSGNVSEFPAFTGRTLFVDEASYMTTPHKDFQRRAEIATRLSQGVPPSATDAAYLEYQRRPMYLLSYAAGNSQVMSQLSRLYGAPVFQDAFVAVFDFAMMGHSGP